MASKLGLFIILVAISSNVFSSKIQSENRAGKKIVIVGAGVAGISAATHLIELGFSDITLYEAGQSWGGRIVSIPWASNVIDLGAQWCHGQGDNPVWKLGKPFNLFGVTPDPYWWHFTKPDGTELPLLSASRCMWILEEIVVDYAEELAVYKGNLGDFITEKYYERLSSPIFATIPKDVRAQALEFYHRYLNADIAADNWFDVSASGDLEYWEYPGVVNNNWKDNGFGTIFKLLTKSYPNKTSETINIEEKIITNKTVTNISYRRVGEKTQVLTNDGLITEADHVIVTVSLGVLKERHEKLFTPLLPEYKVRAINGLTLGTVDKLFLEFDKPFWPEDFTGLKIIWTEKELEEIRKRNDSYIEGVMAFDLVAYQPNIFMGWISGPFARRMELADSNEVKEGCMFLLRKFLPQMTIPEPKNFLRTNWYSNENFRGSYSFRSVASDQLNTSSIDLARPLLDNYNTPVVHFAGEATSHHYYSTVHGAIESGWREADMIASYY